MLLLSSYFIHIFISTLLGGEESSISDDAIYRGTVHNTNKLSRYTCCIEAAR